MNKPTGYPIAEVVWVSQIENGLQVVVECPYCGRRHCHGTALLEDEERYEHRGSKCSTRDLKKKGLTSQGSYYFLVPTNVPR